MSKNFGCFEYNWKVITLSIISLQIFSWNDFISKHPWKIFYLLSLCRRSRALSRAKIESSSFFRQPWLAHFDIRVCFHYLPATISVHSQWLRLKQDCFQFWEFVSWNLLGTQNSSKSCCSTVTLLFTRIENWLYHCSILFHFRLCFF